MNPSDHIPIDVHVFEPFYVSVSREVSRQLLKHSAIPPEITARQIADHLVIRVRQAVASQVVDAVEYRCPASWREGVKDALYSWLGSGWSKPGHWPWFGDFCRERWPVRYKIDRVEDRLLYPQIPVPDPRLVPRGIARVVTTRTEPLDPWGER